MLLQKKMLLNVFKNKKISENKNLSSINERIKNISSGKRCKSCSGIPNDIKQDLYIILKEDESALKIFQNHFGTYGPFFLFFDNGTGRKELMSVGGKK